MSSENVRTLCNDCSPHLQIVVSESRQMAALLNGMNLAMHMANRLKVYFDYFKCLPSTLATENFKNALIRTYTHVLRFIATAIQTYQENVVSRTRQALWQTSDLVDFETKSDKLGSQAEIEASNCDRELRAQKWENAKQWKEDLEKALWRLDEIQGIKGSLALLQVKGDLTKLTTAKRATYNSHAEADSATCLEGTRTQLLRQIADWADDADGKCFFWLCGKAGTGKSTISRTVAHVLDKQRRLGASFFFKRGEGDRGNAGRVFPTLAAQLADINPGLKSSIAHALDSDSFLCERNLQDQFEKLLLQPLLDAVLGQSPPPSLVVVIDALDECEPHTDIRKVLTLLSQVEAITSLRLRVFVTSRPELPVQLGFRNIDGSLHQDIMLEEVQNKTIEHDIRVYFKYRFEEIKAEDTLRQPYDVLPVDWPGEHSIQALVDLAVPLFIFAFTVCRFISESDPKRRLKTILQQPKYMSFSGLDKTYLPILNQLILERDKQEHNHVIAEFRNVVGPIILLANPLSAPSLSSLLEISLRDIGEVLRHLHSVLNISTDRDGPIRLLHLSFRDFLVDPQGKETNRFWIDEAWTHGRLAEQCIRRLNRPGTLEQDLCGIRKPGIRRAEISKQRVVDSIADDVAYACCYWVWHLAESGEKVFDDGQVHKFLQSQLLHWLEALSWLGRLSSAIDYVHTLRSMVKVSHASIRL